MSAMPTRPTRNCSKVMRAAPIASSCQSSIAASAASASLSSGASAFVIRRWTKPYSSAPIVSSSSSLPSVVQNCSAAACSFDDEKSAARAARCSSVSHSSEPCSWYARPPFLRAPSKWKVLSLSTALGFAADGGDALPTADFGDTRPTVDGDARPPEMDGGDARPATI